jgi:hypothetical protein
MPIAPPDGGAAPYGAAPGGGIIGAPAGGIIGPPGAAPGMPPPGKVLGGAASAAPQLRQNFIPGGFWPWHTPQITGNPPAPGEVWTDGGGAAGAADSELPQLRQNDDPAGLSWPHIEQRIGPLGLNRRRVSQVLPAI